MKIIIKNMIKQRLNSPNFLFYYLVINISLLFASFNIDLDTDQYSKGDVVITEIYFQPAENKNIFEYFELYNSTDDTIDLVDWSLEINNINYSIDSSIKIDPNDEVIFFGLSGQFSDSNENIYCSQITPPNILNIGNCDVNLSTIYWLKFSALPNDNLILRLYDSNSILIDSLGFNDEIDEWKEIIGSQNAGKSIEFIRDPRIDGHIHNDNGYNWRSSQFNENILWSDSNDFGSPLLTNFIDIEIIAQATNFDSSYFDYATEKLVHSPKSDGYPGGDVDLEITFEFLDLTTEFDSIRWNIYNVNSEIIDTNRTDSIWYTNSIEIDTVDILDIYTLELFLRKPNGIMTNKEFDLYLKQEVNHPPTVQIITESGFSDNIINIYDDSLTLVLGGDINDIELCNTSISCNFSDLFFPNPFYPLYDNNSPFLWTTSNNVIGNLESINLLETIFYPDSIIRVEEGSENQIQYLYNYHLTATDPFGSSGIDSVQIIVHNRNQRPTLTLDKDVINNLDIIAGYSFQLDVVDFQVQLLEYDASGIPIDTSIIGNVSDADGDDYFAVNFPNAQGCFDGFDNKNYCYVDNKIQTNQNLSYENLVIPIVVNDTIVSKVDGYSSSNLSLIDTIIINNVNYVTHSINFSNIKLINNNYHIPEDSTNIEFSISFNLDQDENHSLNMTNLEWGIYELTKADTLRLFISKDDSNDINSNIKHFRIDSLYKDFNGEAGIKITAKDANNNSVTVSDSIEIDLHFLIEQRNDLMNDFSLVPTIISEDLTTFSYVRDTLFFRLPQDDNGETISDPKTELIFEWERNEVIDVDIVDSLNKNMLYEVFYRLELFDSENIIVLADSINHYDQNYIEKDHFSILIDIAQFNEIDISGNTIYQWRVVAQNYTNDNLDNDPQKVSKKWNLTDFKIDLIPPKIEQMNFLINPHYPGYYDIIWNSNGLLLSDSTFVNINDLTNQFGSISDLNPREITDSLYHLSSFLSNNINSATINYNLELRDKAMNTGGWNDTFSYQLVDPSYPATINSYSNLVEVQIPSNAFDSPNAIFLRENKMLQKVDRVDDSLYQISPSISFISNDIILNNSSRIIFDIRDYTNYQVSELVIASISNEETIVYKTNYQNGTIFTDIDSLLTFAIFVNKKLNQFVPNEFLIYNNFPNPFNSSTIIPFQIPNESYINASVYNILGQEILTILEGVHASGYYHLKWNGEDRNGNYVSSGIYFMKIKYNNKYYSKKMILLK